MRNKPILFILCIYFALMFYSCTCPCVKGELRFDLVGFTDAEADTIIIKKYDKNSSFNIPRDSFFEDEVRYTRYSDTLKLVAYSGSLVMESDFDYELYFPQSQSLFRLTEISETKNEQSCGIFSTNKVACINEVTSCKINNVVVSTSWFSKIYIHK